MESMLIMLQKYLYIFSWQDAAEIFFFATLIYYCSLWLKKDRQKNLLGYFYAYFLLLFLTYNFHIETVNYALILLSPMIFMVFVLIHQSTLQKNFVGLRNLLSPRYANSDWLEIIMQTALININNNKELTYVIEHTESLNDLLVTPIPMYAEIKKEFLEIMVDSQSCKPSGMIWLTSQGILRGINAQWKIAQEFYADDAAQQSWKEEALFFTAKTDALVIKTHPKERTFDLIVHGNIIEQCTADKIVVHVKKALGKTHINQKGIVHAPHTVKERNQQPHA